MTGGRLLANLASRGIHVALEDARLRYVVLGAAPEAEVTHELRARKVDLLRELLWRMREERVGDLGRDPRWWRDAEREVFEERAAIMEFDGNVEREAAELLAEARTRQLRSGRRAP